MEDLSMSRKISTNRLSHLKKMASRLGKDLPKEPHSKCLDIIARLEGFPDWRTLTLAVDDSAPSAEVPSILGTAPNDSTPSLPWDDEAWLGRLVAAIHTEFRRTGREPLFLGFTGGETPLLADLGANQHSLFLGSSGSGKTNAMQAAVYVMAKAFPATKFLFADGKATWDWNEAASALSPLPVATTRIVGPQKVMRASMDDLISAAWMEVKSRIALFEAANASGHKVRNIEDYRRQVGALPAVVIVMDDFGDLIWNWDFDVSYSEEGTTANRLKRLIAESGWLGIHVFISSQGYSDVPMPLRWLIGNMVVFRGYSNAGYVLNMPEAASLKRGELLVETKGFEGAKREAVKASIPEFKEPGKLFGRLAGRK
jgi:hypothetical protein